AHEWAAAQWQADGRRVLMISPCSSHLLRNWSAARYAALANHALRQDWKVVLCGGRSELERRTADAIVAATDGPVLDLVGKDTLKQLPALLARADLLVTPDSGPMHIANAMGTAVLGLHAASNPARSGPYSDRRYCVDRYDEAARRYLGKPATELKWGTKIESDGVMELVTVEDAIAAFERYVADHPRGRRAPVRPGPRRTLRRKGDSRPLPGDTTCGHRTRQGSLPRCSGPCCMAPLRRRILASPDPANTPPSS